MSFQVNSADLKHGTEIKESVSTAEDEFKNSTAAETDRKLVPEDEEEFKKTRTEKLKRKLVPEDEDDEEEEQRYEHSGLRLKRLENAARYHCSGKRRALKRRLSLWRKKCKLEDKDEEDKEISRTQSMDNLALMQKPQRK